MAPACEPDNVRLLTPMWPLNYGSVISRLAASIRQTEVSLSLSHAAFATWYWFDAARCRVVDRNCSAARLWSDGGKTGRAVGRLL